MLKQAGYTVLFAESGAQALHTVQAQPVDVILLDFNMPRMSGLDTFFGAMLGIFTAKVVNGRWRVFGIRPPEFMVTPAGAPCLQWKGTF